MDKPLIEVTAKINNTLTLISTAYKLIPKGITENIIKRQFLSMLS